MSQWRCKDCGAIRKRPHRVIYNEAIPFVAFLGRPCKRCGSRSEPNAEIDPWLDFDEDGLDTCLAGKVA